MKRAAIIFWVALFSLYILAGMSVFAQVAVTIEKQTTDKGLLSGISSACAESGQCTLVDFMVVVKNIFLLLRKLAFWVAVGFGIYGGITLIISQGNPSKIKSGKNIILAAFIGLMIVYGVSLIINIIILIINKQPINLEEIWNPHIILVNE